MTPKILMRNVRGLNAIEKRLEIKGFLRDWKADIVSLVETKMTVISREVVRSYGVAIMLISATWVPMERRVEFC
jgi:hypothetical protein